MSEKARPVFVERGSRFGRVVFWVFLVVGLLGALLVGINAAGLLPGLRNPFVAETHDKSQPPVLIKIRDLSRFVAAEGTYEVVIDLKQDRRFVPDWLLNQRTLFVAAGTVESFVDFGQLNDSNIVESADHKTVTIKLPPPALDEPELDIERSYVFAEERGLFNRVSEFFGGDLNRQQQVMIEAEKKLAEASKVSGLQQRAEENTRKTLEGLLGALGYTSVTVTFG